MTALILNNNIFSGILPDLFDALENLSILSLQLNHFVGPIPKSLCNLTNLHYLSVSSNFLNGSLPCSFQFLHLLDLSNNSFTGNLNIMNMNYPSMTSISLAFNYFSGSFPLLFLQSDNLEAVDFSCNELTSFYSNGSLLDCSLSNVINSVYAPGYGYASKSYLSKLTLEDNYLQDNVLDVIYCLQILAPRLVYLDLSQNELVGELNDDGLTLYTQSVNIDGSYTAETTQVIALNKLTFFNVSSNRISGPVSSAWTNYTIPIVLDLSVNLFNSWIPYSLLDSSTVSLYVQGNPFLSDLSPITMVDIDPFILSTAYDSLSLSQDVSLLNNMSCPTIYRASHTLLIDVSYFQYRQCSCVENYYVELNPTTHCLFCPERIQCNQSVILPWHRPFIGYYPVFSSSSLISAIKHTINDENLFSYFNLEIPRQMNFREGVSFALPIIAFKFYNTTNLTQIPRYLLMGWESNLLLYSTLIRCQFVSDCLGYQPDNLSSDYPIFECADGKSSDAFLCSLCKSNYFSITNKCYKCPSYYYWSAPLCNGLVLLAIFLIILFEQNKSPHCIITITFFWLQLLYILNLSYTARENSNYISGDSNNFILFQFIISISNFTNLGLLCFFPEII